MKRKSDYLIQDDDYSCGPVAVNNAHLWKYGHCKYSISKLAKLSNTEEENGTDRTFLYIKNLCTTSRPINNISKIKKALYDGNGIILLYFHKKDSIIKHYVFVTYENNKFNVYNYILDDQYKHTCFNTWNDIYETILKNNYTDKFGVYPCAWIINK